MPNHNPVHKPESTASVESHKTVLNINDNEAIRYILTRMLQSGGYKVIEAINGREGLLQSLQLPDLILLDVQLPDIHGYDVCKSIRAEEITAKIPIMMISAVLVQSEDIDGGLAAGADKYLTHPVPVVDLLGAVAHLIGTQEVLDNQL